MKILRRFGRSSETAKKYPRAKSASVWLPHDPFLANSYERSRTENGLASREPEDDRTKPAKDETVAKQTAPTQPSRTEKSTPRRKDDNGHKGKAPDATPKPDTSHLMEELAAQARTPNRAAVKKETGIWPPPADLVLFGHRETGSPPLPEDHDQIQALAEDAEESAARQRLLQILTNLQCGVMLTRLRKLKAIDENFQGPYIIERHPASFRQKRWQKRLFSDVEFKIGLYMERSHEHHHWAQAIGRTWPHTLYGCIIIWAWEHEGSTYLQVVSGWNQHYHPPVRYEPARHNQVQSRIAALLWHLPIVSTSSLTAHLGGSGGGSQTSSPPS